jgi:acetyltransferase-like isoleucine patch superfamily enzyme
MIRQLRSIKNIILGRNPQPVPAPIPNFGLKVGEGTYIGPPRRVEGQQYISIGNNSYVGKETWLGAYDAYPNSGQTFTPQISIGNNVFIGSFSMITCVNKVIIEDFVETADFLYISDHVHSITPEEGVPISKRRLISRGYVKIGAYTGLGIHVCILPGVTLGKYCIVGANSVVTKSFPDYCLIMGNPAEVVKMYDPEKKKWIDPPPSKKSVQSV